MHCRHFREPDSKGDNEGSAPCPMYCEWFQSNYQEMINSFAKSEFSTSVEWLIEIQKRKIDTTSVSRNHIFSQPPLLFSPLPISQPPPQGATE